MSGKSLKLFLKYYLSLFNDHELIVYAGLKNNDLNLVSNFLRKRKNSLNA